MHLSRWKGLHNDLRVLATITGLSHGQNLCRRPRYQTLVETVLASCILQDDETRWYIGRKRLQSRIWNLTSTPTVAKELHEFFFCESILIIYMYSCTVRSCTREGKSSTCMLIRCLAPRLVNPQDGTWYTYCTYFIITCTHSCCRGWYNR